VLIILLSTKPGTAELTLVRSANKTVKLRVAIREVAIVFSTVSNRVAIIIILRVRETVPPTTQR